MRATQNIPQTVTKRPLDEPVYVDEIFPEEEIRQDDPWARKNAEKEEPLEALEEILKFEEEEDVEPAAPSPSVKPTPAPRSYRMKTPARSSHRSEAPRSANRNPLPTELPRPPRKERTGTWPIEPDPRRNGSNHVKNGHPTQPSPPERAAPLPIQRQPPAPVVPSPFADRQTSRETPPMSENPPPARQESVPISPPPLLPPMPPIRPSPPQGVLPVENVPSTSSQATFRPLVDETPREGETSQERGWEEIDPIRPNTSLDALLERLPLPQNSLILGVCDDGLPLVLELSDPSPGALLFLGDEVEGLRKHLQAVLASVCLLSDPKQVQVDIISPQPEVFTAQKRFPHVQKIHLPDQNEMFDLLGCLFELIEQRQRKDNSLAGKFLKEFLPSNKGPARILMIDQLDVLVEQLAPESLAYLRWLLRRGPAANVWVLASVNAQNAQTVDGKTLNAFGLRVAGKLRNTAQASRLTDLPLDKLSNLVAGEQACIKLDENVIEFSILEI